MSEIRAMEQMHVLGSCLPELMYSTCRELGQRCIGIYDPPPPLAPACSSLPSCLARSRALTLFL
eukprot:81879-Rhodomonas_salina.1